MGHFLVDRGKKSIHYNITPEIFFKRCKRLVNPVRKYIVSVPNLWILYKAFMFFSTLDKKSGFFLKKKILRDRMEEREERERREGGRRSRKHWYLVKFSFLQYLAIPHGFPFEQHRTSWHLHRLDNNAPSLFLCTEHLKSFTYSWNGIAFSLSPFQFLSYRLTVVKIFFASVFPQLHIAPQNKNYLHLSSSKKLKNK